MLNFFIDAFAHMQNEFNIYLFFLFHRAIVTKV